LDGQNSRTHWEEDAAAQVERFGTLYCIFGPLIVEDTLPVDDGTGHAALSGAAMVTSPGGSLVDLSSTFIDFDAAADGTIERSATKQQPAKKRDGLRTRSGDMVIDHDDQRKGLEKVEQRTSESYAAIRAQEHADREATREGRRRQKLEIRIERNRFAQTQREEAMRRAEALVKSNRVPIEIVRGAAAKRVTEAKIKVDTDVASEPKPEHTATKRSAIVVSTASDLHQIVTHAENLYAKYNAVAREHNQKVGWSTISRDLGIHVKVRQKYSRMHKRAEQRNFDWQVNGHWKVKDHPEIFLAPTDAEKKAKVPPPPPDDSKTVAIGDNSGETDAAEGCETYYQSQNAVSNAKSCADDCASGDGRESDDQSSTLIQDPTTGHTFSV
jgi:hypothetical protein